MTIKLLGDLGRRHIISALPVRQAKLPELLNEKKDFYFQIVIG